MAQRTLVIVNPRAGSGVEIEHLRDRFTLDDFSMEVTSAPGEARELAERALRSGVSFVVAVGGDGTIHEIINGLAPDFGRCRLGIVPAGTGNDTARSLGIPLDMEKAVDRLLSGNAQRIDLIEINRSGQVSYAINAATGGFGGAVGEAMSGEVKDFWGSLAYVRAAAEVIPEPPAYDLEVVIDEEESRSLRVVSFVVANGRFAAHGIPVAPGARLADGMLSVHAVLESTPTELIVLATALLRGDVPDHENYLQWECRRTRVSARQTFPVSVDGEQMEVEEVSYTILPACLEIIG